MTEEIDTSRAAPANQADAPPAVTSGCCSAGPVVTVAPVAVPCCGTADAAQAAGCCCDPAAKSAAVGAGAGCCG